LITFQLILQPAFSTPVVGTSLATTNHSFGRNSTLFSSASIRAPSSWVFEISDLSFSGHCSSRAEYQASPIQSVRQPSMKFDNKVGGTAWIDQLKLEPIKSMVMLTSLELGQRTSRLPKNLRLN